MDRTSGHFKQPVIEYRMWLQVHMHLTGKQLFLVDFVILKAVHIVLVSVLKPVINSK